MPDLAGCSQAIPEGITPQPRAHPWLRAREDTAVVATWAWPPFPHRSRSSSGCCRGPVRMCLPGQFTLVCSSASSSLLLPSGVPSASSVSPSPWWRHLEGPFPPTALPLPHRRAAPLSHSRGNAAFPRLGVGTSLAGSAAAVAALDPDSIPMAKETWPSTSCSRERSSRRRGKDAEREGALSQAPGGIRGGKKGRTAGGRDGSRHPALPGMGWPPSHGAFPGRSLPSRTGASSFRLVTNIHPYIWKLPFVPHKQFRPNTSLARPEKPK